LSNIKKNIKEVTKTSFIMLFGLICRPLKTIKLTLSTKDACHLSR
jgi:hypothetical protein